MVSMITKCLVSIVSSFFISCSATSCHIDRRPLGEIIQDIRSPEDAHEWLNSQLEYVSDDEQFGRDFWSSLKMTNVTRQGDCDDFAVGANALLCDDGIDGRILEFYYGYDAINNRQENEKGQLIDFGHAVYVFRRDGKIGVVQNGDYYPPVYEDLPSLIRSINESRGVTKAYHNYRIRKLSCILSQFGSLNLNSTKVESEGYFFSDDMKNFIKTKNTSQKVQEYISSLERIDESHYGGFFRTFIHTFYSKRASPLNAAKTAAVIFNNGSRNVFIAEFDHNGSKEAVYLYPHQKGFGAISQNPEFYREPMDFSSLTKSLPVPIHLYINYKMRDLPSSLE